MGGGGIPASGAAALLIAGIKAMIVALAAIHPVNVVRFLFMVEVLLMAMQENDASAECRHDLGIVMQKKLE